MQNLTIYEPGKAIGTYNDTNSVVRSHIMIWILLLTAKAGQVREWRRLHHLFEDLTRQTEIPHWQRHWEWNRASSRFGSIWQRRVWGQWRCLEDHGGWRTWLSLAGFKRVHRQAWRCDQYQDTAGSVWCNNSSPGQLWRPRPKMCWCEEPGAGEPAARDAPSLQSLQLLAGCHPWEGLPKLPRYLPAGPKWADECFWSDPRLLKQVTSTSNVKYRNYSTWPGISAKWASGKRSGQRDWPALMPARGRRTKSSHRRAVSQAGWIRKYGSDDDNDLRCSPTPKNFSWFCASSGGPANLWKIETGLKFLSKEIMFTWGKVWPKEKGAGRWVPRPLQVLWHLCLFKWECDQASQQLYLPSWHADATILANVQHVIRPDETVQGRDLEVLQEEPDQDNGLYWKGVRCSVHYRSGQLN